MSPVQRLGLLTLLGLFLVGVFASCASIAHADAPSLTDRIAALVPSLASKRDEPVDAREFAEAVTAVPRVTREWAALLLTIASAESGLSDRIRRGEFKDYEADSYKDADGTVYHKAFGLFQSHRNKINDAVWGSTDIGVQTTEAARALRSAFYSCNPRGKIRADWVARTINCYAGRGPTDQWTGLDKRLNAYSRILRKL